MALSPGGDPCPSAGATGPGTFGKWTLPVPSSSASEQGSLPEASAGSTTLTILLHGLMNFWSMIETVIDVEWMS